MKRVLKVTGKVLVRTLIIVALLGIGVAYMAGITGERNNCENAGGVYVAGGLLSGASCAIPPVPIPESTTDTKGTP